MPFYTGAPRVRVVEKDLSTIPNAPAFPNTTVGIIGCGLKGPIGYAVRLQSPSQLQNLFGLPNTQSNKSLIAAATILNAGGNVQFVNVPRGQYYRHVLVSYNSEATSPSTSKDIADVFTFAYKPDGVRANVLTAIDGEFTLSAQSLLSKAKQGAPYGVDFSLESPKTIGFVSRAAGSSQDAEWKISRFEPAVAVGLTDIDEDSFRDDTLVQTVLNKINPWAQSFAVSGYLKALNQLIRVTFSMVQNPEVTTTVVFSVSSNPLLHTINGISYDIKDAFANTEIYAEAVGFSDSDVVKFDFTQNGFIEAAKVNVPFLFEEPEFSSDLQTFTEVSAGVSGAFTTSVKTVTAAGSNITNVASAEYVVNSNNVDGENEDSLIVDSVYYEYFFGDVEQLKVDLVLPVLKTSASNTLQDRINAVDTISNSKAKKVPANVTLALINGTMSDNSGSYYDYLYQAKGATDADGNKIPKVSLSASVVDSGYALYYGEITVRNFLGRIPLVKLPLNVVAAAIMCFNDFRTGTYAPWLAPMGVDGGSIDAIIPGIVITSDAVTQKVADALYDARVNFVKNIPGYGNVIMGQKTAQLQATALNRINVRRLVNYIKYIIYRISFPYIGRLNTVQQRANLAQEITDFMDRVKFNDGVYAYRLILDDSNNTPDVIDNNGLVAELKIQPTKVIEYIDPITITITRTGVTL